MNFRYLLSLSASMLVAASTLIGCGAEDPEFVEEPVGTLESAIFGTYTYDGPITTSLFDDTGVSDVLVGINAIEDGSGFLFFLSNIGSAERVNYCIRVQCPNFVDAVRRNASIGLGPVSDRCQAEEPVEVELKLNDDGPASDCP
jgi:hypothetical protein